MALFADHSDLSLLANAAQLNAGHPHGSRFGLIESFWASPERSGTDPIADVLDVTLTDQYRVNWLQFDVARFPHTVTAEYWDESSNSWLPLMQPGGSAVELTILDCVPAVLPPPSSVPGHQNPQHAFTGHWQTERITLVPTEISRLRLILRRIPTATPPVDVYGNPASYSLAVRDFSLGYQVASRDDVPATLTRTDVDNGSYHDSFASASDVVGSVVEFSLRTLGASRAALDNAPDAAWESEPQPDPDCVVNLYVDVRDANQQAQVVDRIYLDPTTTGPHLSLYFSQQTEFVDFASADNPLAADQIDATPGVTLDAQGLHFRSSTGYPGSESLIIDNTVLDFRPDHPWWIGLVVTPSFDPPAAPTFPSSTYNVIFDCGAWLLAWTDTGLAVQFATGEQMPLDVNYQGGLQTTVVVSSDGSEYRLWASSSAFLGSTSMVASQPLDRDSCAAFALGSDLTRTFFGQSDLVSLVVKQELPPPDGSAYATDPAAYTRVTEYAADEPATSRYNAILRFDPQTSMVSNAYPWALFGGGFSRYESMIWTPVPRDFTCQRGWMKIPPVKAKYWKLEFTRLSPTYADVYVPVQQRVQHFPKSVLDDYRTRAALANPTPNPVDQAHADLTTYSNYLDTPRNVSTGGTGLGFTSTEAYIADDLQAADRLYARQGENWNYQRFLSPLSAPRFNTTQRHVYQTELVTRTSKLAYRVGLRSLRFARSIPSINYDTPQYEDEFFDLANLNPAATSWVFDPEQYALTSGLSTHAQIQSRTMQSNRPVRGVQFAAQQSQPSQLLPDANFDDPTHTQWSAVGNARLLPGVVKPGFDLLLPVTRTLRLGYWGDIAPLYQSWGAAQSAGLTWGQLEAGLAQAASNPQSSGGEGITSTAVVTPQGGYVHAAARVWADRDLYTPLWVQIVDSVTGAVLNESPMTVRKGQVAEWYTSYEIDTALAPRGVTWGDLQGDQYFPSFLDHFARSNQTGLGRMDSGQYWATGVQWNGQASVSLDVVSDAAMVNTAGARSIIDVTTPWGSLAVTLGTLITPGTPVELITLGTLILRSDGAVMDPNTGYVYTTLTLAAGDSLQFDFMPTAHVPTAQSSGADASIRSWSMVITRNGSFVSTVSTVQPFSTVRGLAGAVGQTFTAFSWTGVNINAPDPTMIYELPMPRDGAFDSSGTTWVQTSDGRSWSLNGSITQVDGGIVQSIQAPAGQTFELDTDIGALYGAMTFQVTLSTTTTDKTSYYVAKLDDTPQGQLWLRADGALVQTTPSLGATVLNATAVGSFTAPTTVLFLQTRTLSATFLSAYSLSAAYAQTLVFLNGTTVVGTAQGDSLFVGTVRGVLGCDGSKISGFTWAPDLGAVDTGQGARTWDNLSGGGTRLWSDVVRSTTALINPVEARVIQKDPSQDVWYMDALALYVDPIVWEFSNDGGQSWVSASAVRSDPNGVVLFPSTGIQATQLQYRVTAYDTNTWLSHLVIRPWYLGYMRGMPTLADSPEGPNLNPIDLYPPIEQDPHFMGWNKPIPREFFLAFQSMLRGKSPHRSRTPFASERALSG